MQIGLIWAQAKGGVIANKGAMPWHLPEDLAHFKRSTLGCPVLMGRKTWDSLPARAKPLPGRLNVVVSRNLSAADFPEPSQATCSPSLGAALQTLRAQQHPKVWVMGGGEIYAQAISLAHELLVTEIDTATPGDTFAPQIDLTRWRANPSTEMVSATGLRYRFKHYTKQE